MPLFEYGCYDCAKVSEILVRKGPVPTTIQCPHCESDHTLKLVSRVHFKTYKKPKYDDDFLGKALPSMRKKKETAELFAEGEKASDEAKMFQMSERIGESIDKEIGRHFPKK